jgi:hypothetical protein
MDLQPLLSLYGSLASVLERSGRVYPAVIDLIRAPATGLAKLSAEALWVDPELRAGGRAHLEAVARRSPTMHDGQVLACAAVSGFPLEYASGGYFDAIATSDSLRAEYLRAPRPISGLSALPLRALAHRAAGGDPLRSGRGRVAAVGVSVAVTMPRGPVRDLIIGRRSDAVATDPGIWHIAPSGTLEPVEGDAVIQLVRHELAEELSITLPTPDRLEERLITLGVSHDLLRLRPEICLRLDLEPHEYPSGGPHLAFREFQELDLVELSSRGLERFWQAHPPDQLTAAGAGTIALLERQAGFGQDSPS